MEGEEGSCCSVTPDLLPVRNGLEFAEGAVAVKVPQPRLWGTGLWRRWEQTKVV